MEINSGMTIGQWTHDESFFFKIHILNVLANWADGPNKLVVKTGYLKRSQRYELAILRPFLAIFSQTTLKTFSKVKF